jgi:GNAT superfamily N-acetyltransferase
MIQFKRLTDEYLLAASEVAYRVFYYEGNIPGEAFIASLTEKALTEFNKGKTEKIITLEYWVAVDSDTNVVLGTTGMYSIEEDLIEAYWLGWFCVGHEFRGRGVGLLLLDFTIREATSRGKKYLRLYTSNHPNEAAAQFLYEKKGFKIWEDKGRVKSGEWEIFYRQKKLIE